MKYSIKTLIFSSGLLLFVASSCSKDDSEGDTELFKEGGPFEFSELAGNWEATGALFLRPFSNLGGAEIIGDGGSVSLTVQNNGKCTFTIDPFDCEAYTESGEMFWELYEGDYYFAIKWDAYPDDWATYGATHTDTTFFMNGGSDAGEYDFDNDGTSESAGLNFAFIRI